MSRLTTFAGGTAVGAAFMYLVDPNGGRRRRARVRDKLTRAKRELGDASETTARDLKHRTRGLVAELAGFLRADDADDDVIAARVHSRLGQVCSHPGAIEVACHRGDVWLHGDILTSELDRVASAVARVQGVRKAMHDLRVHESGEGVPALQGGVPRSGPRFELQQRNWAPAARLLAGAGGLGLVSAARRLPPPLRAGVGLAGLALAARAATNLEVKRLLGFGDRRAIDIKKAIHIHAPVAEVFGFWQAMENFPKFMSHVTKVEKRGDDLYHWEVQGPGGVTFRWDAAITQLAPNRILAWKSVGGASVPNAGIVRFDESAEGATRVQVLLSYNPPAGALGHAFAKLLGADPKKQMDDDLLRLKSLIEAGRTRGRGETIHKDDLAPRGT